MINTLTAETIPPSSPTTSESESDSPSSFRPYHFKQQQQQLQQQPQLQQQQQQQHQHQHQQQRLVDDFIIYKPTLKDTEVLYSLSHSDYYHGYIV